MRHRHQHAGDHDAERRDRVAEHVQIGAADVEVVLRAAVQPDADHEIQDDRGRGHADHHDAVGGLRLTDSGDRFPADDDRNHQERDGIAEGREDADAVVAEGHALVGWLVATSRARTS